MVFPVLPLKTLVTRQVIRERMEYKDYLGGRAREELDWLERFQGKFFVDSFKFVVLREENGRLSEEEWQSLKSTLPTDVISFLDGKPDFSIFEKSGKSEEREWELQDIDGSTKTLHLCTRVKEDDSGWEFHDQIVTDGVMVTWHSFLDTKGEMLCAEQDFFHMDDEGILRKKICYLPNLKMKIKMYIETSREDVIQDNQK